jgi:hypothetical protein
MFKNAVNFARRHGSTVGNAVAVPALALAGMAAAHADETFAVPTSVTTAGANAAILGAAVLVVLIGIKAWKWIRSAA